MRIDETVNQPTVITKDIICDRCGKSCKGLHGFNFEGLFASTSGGFGTWFDEETIFIDLCTKCLNELCIWIWGEDKTKWRINS